MEPVSDNTVLFARSVADFPDTPPLQTRRRFPRVVAATVAMIALLVCTLGVRRVSREEERASDTFAIPANGSATFRVCRRSTAECLGTVTAQTKGRRSLEVALDGKLSGREDGDTIIRGQFSFSAYRLLEYARIDIQSKGRNFRALSNPDDATRATVAIRGTDGREQSVTLPIPQPVLLLGGENGGELYFVFPAYLNVYFGDLDVVPEGAANSAPEPKFVAAKADLVSAAFAQLRNFSEGES